MNIPGNPYNYPQYTEKKAYAVSQKDMMRWFVEWLEEKGILVVAETDRVLLKLVEHSQPNALLLNITDIQDLKDMAELEKE